VLALRPPKGRGHEQQGRRFGVVVQADAFLPRSTVLVAPTSTSAKPATFRPEITVDGVTTRVLVEQLGAVDLSRLGNSAGQLTAPELWAVDTALLTVLDLT
jgi:mRNA interferase MazF